MNTYIIEVDTRGYELYEITADSEEEAREIYFRDTLEPYQSEVVDSEVVKVSVRML